MTGVPFDGGSHLPQLLAVARAHRPQDRRLQRRDWSGVGTEVIEKQYPIGGRDKLALH